MVLPEQLDLMELQVLVLRAQLVFRVFKVFRVQLVFKVFRGIVLLELRVHSVLVDCLVLLDSLDLLDP